MHKIQRRVLLALSDIFSVHKANYCIPQQTLFKRVIKLKHVHNPKKKSGL